MTPQEGQTRGSPRLLVPSSAPCLREREERQAGSKSEAEAPRASRQGWDWPVTPMRGGGPPHQAMLPHQPGVQETASRGTVQARGAPYV